MPYGFFEKLLNKGDFPARKLCPFLLASQRDPFGAKMDEKGHPE